MYELAVSIHAALTADRIRVKVRKEYEILLKTNPNPFILVEFC